MLCSTDVKVSEEANLRAIFSHQIFWNDVHLFSFYFLRRDFSLGLATNASSHSSVRCARERPLLGQPNQTPQSSACKVTNQPLKRCCLLLILTNQIWKQAQMNQNTL